MRTLQHLLRAYALAIAGVALGISPAWSAEFYLEARPLVGAEYPVGIPATVPMWGYALCGTTDFSGCGTVVASVPGPQLVVPAGETSLTIHLKNSLPATGLSVPNMTSIVIPGQREDNMAPVMFPAEPNPHDGGATTRVRMRSFTHETAQGTIGDYVWSNLKPGTYLYHSGTHAQVQVQMGLYGSVKADAAIGHAYAGQAYNSEATLLFSEIDEAIHAEVAGGTYGSAGHPTSTINFKPNYFLMNGAPYSASTAPIAAGQAGQRVLLRLLNAGIESHVATLLGGRFQVIAEDGNPLAHARDQYETLLAAGKTMDAIWMPTAEGTYSIYDRRNRQGMLAKLKIGTGAAAAPTAVNDAYVTMINTPLVVAGPGVLANDQNATVATAVRVTSPASGTLVLNTNGSFSYTPNVGFGGQDSFTYTANNGANASNVATVTIRVNRPPVAVTNTATTPEDTAAVISTATLLANDSDPDGNPLTVTGVGSAVNGTVSLVGPTVTFTPALNYNGTGASFTYSISDGFGGTATATVNVTVTAVNDAPVATADAVTTPYNTAVIIQAATLLSNDSDVDGNPLTVTGVSNAVNGTVSRSPSTGAITSITFTPNATANSTGTGSFTYTISDGQGGTATATVTVTVLPQSARAVTSITLRNNSNGNTIVSSLVNGASVNLTSLCSDCQVSFEAVTSPTSWANDSVTLALTGATSLTVTDTSSPFRLPSNNGITLTPGQHTLTATPYTTSNGVSTAGTPLTVSFTIVKTSPTANNDAYSTPSSGTSTQLTVAAPGVLANDVNPTTNPMTAVLVTGTTGLTLNSNGSFTYNPPAGVTGTRSFIYRANNGANSNTATVTINIINLPPTAGNDAVTATENTAQAISVASLLANDSDPNGQTLTVTTVGNAVNGTVTLSGTTITFTPAANYSGAGASFTYNISDGAGGMATATVNVTVNKGNSAPVAVANSYAVNKQTAFTVAAPGVLANDTDADSNPLTAIADTTAGGRVSLNANGSFTYTTTSDYVGTRTFSYHANDGLLNSNVVNVTLVKDLTVRDITAATDGNGNPIWAIRGRSTTPGSTVTVYLGATATGTAIGTVTVNGNGSWRLNVSQVTYPTLSGVISASSSTGAQVIEVPAP